MDHETATTSDVKVKKQDRKNEKKKKMAKSTDDNLDKVCREKSEHADEGAASGSSTDSDDLVHAINYNTITSLAALKDIIQGDNNDTPETDSFFQHYFMNHCNNLSSLNPNSSSTFPFSERRRLSQCREEDEDDEKKESDLPLLSEEASHSSLVNVTMDHHNSNDIVDNSNHNKTSSKVSLQSGRASEDAASPPKRTVMGARHKFLVTTTEPQPPSDVVEKALRSQVHSAHTVHFGTKGAEEIRPSVRSIFPGQNLHLDKKYFDSSLIEIRSTVDESPTSSEDIWVKRSDEKQKEETASNSGESVKDGNILSPGSEKRTSQMRDRSGTWGAQGSRTDKEPAKKTQFRKDKDVRRSCDDRRQKREQRLEAAITRSTQSVGERKRRGSADDGQPHPMYQQTIHGTNGVSRRPALFDIFKTKPRGDSKKQPSIMKQVKAAVQNMTKTAPTKDLTKPEEAKPEPSKPEAGASAPGTPAVKARDGSAHPHPGSDTRYYHTVTAAATRRPSAMTKMIEIFRGRASVPGQGVPVEGADKRKAMVNKYKRKTSNASWDEEVMKLAMEEASKGSVNSAAKKYGINLSTLQRHIKKGCPKKKLGRYTTIFTDSQEIELLEYVFQMDSLFFGLTKKEFLELVYQYAETNNIPHPFKNGTAGEDWYSGFKTRHPDMSLRRPEPTSLARARGFNKPQVQRFFDLLEGEIDKHKIDATRIYNVDETGIQTNSNKPPRILSRSGKKQVGVLSSVERGKLTTVVCCCNAAGAFIPPFLIFGRKRMVPRLLDGAPPGSVASCTDNGWINGPTFLDWLRHFVAMTRPTSDKKIILVMDNHVSHKYLEVLEYASKNNVIFVSLPPHTTHRLQPLDTCVYAPFKSYFEQAVSIFQRTHVGRIISQYDVARLFGEAYMKAASAHNAIKGFSSTGIWPTNRHIFDDRDYMPSTLTDRPEPVNEEELTTVVTTGPIDETAPEQSATFPPQVSDTEMELQVTEVNRPLTPEITTINDRMQPSPPIKQHKTPLDIRPLPQMTPNVSTRKRKAQKAEILTSTPVKDEQREKENKKKKEPTNAKLKAVKKNLKEPSTNKKKCGEKKKKSKEVKASCSNINKRQARPKRGPKNGQDDESECACLVCAELYAHPPLEDWIRCDDCNMWAHEACTSYSGRGNYYCDACQE